MTMLVCSCNFITEKEIRDVIREMLDEDCWQLIVPGKLYHTMGKRGRCCGCFPNVVDLIVTTTAQYHAERQSPEPDVIDFLGKLKSYQEEQRRLEHERRQRGHRAA